MSDHGGHFFRLHQQFRLVGAILFLEKSSDARAGSTPHINAQNANSVRVYFRAHTIRNRAQRILSSNKLPHAAAGRPRGNGRVDKYDLALLFSEQGK